MATLFEKLKQFARIIEKGDKRIRRRKHKPYKGTKYDAEAEMDQWKFLNDFASWDPKNNEFPVANIATYSGCLKSGHTVDDCFHYLMDGIEVPTQERIELDPVFYATDGNRVIRNYARKIVNGGK